MTNHIPMTREQAWDDLLAALKYAWSHGDADHGATLSFLRTEMERLEGERNDADLAAANEAQLADERFARAEAAEAQLAEAERALREISEVDPARMVLARDDMKRIADIALARLEQGDKDA